MLGIDTDEAHADTMRRLLIRARVWGGVSVAAECLFRSWAKPSMDLVLAKHGSRCGVVWCEIKEAGTGRMTVEQGSGAPKSRHRRIYDSNFR